MMPLPSSGTITIQMIADEFGGSAPHSLSEYYRGGGLVPDTPANAGVPTSGSIKLSDFYGASAGGELVFVGGQIANVGIGGSFESVNVTFRSDGLLTFRGFSTEVNDRWIEPPESASSEYQIRATLLDVAPAPAEPRIGGAGLNTWLDLSANRQWSIFADTIIPAVEMTIQIEMRLGTGSVLLSQNYRLIAEIGQIL